MRDENVFSTRVRSCGVLSTMLSRCSPSGGASNDQSAFSVQAIAASSPAENDRRSIVGQHQLPMFDVGSAQQPAAASDNPESLYAPSGVELKTPAKP
jgi:hypothetical protein